MSQDLELSRSDGSCRSTLAPEWLGLGLNLPELQCLPHPSQELIQVECLPWNRAQQALIQTTEHALALGPLLDVVTVQDYGNGVSCTMRGRAS